MFVLKKEPHILKTLLFLAKEKQDSRQLVGYEKPKSLVDELDTEEYHLCKFQNSEDYKNFMSIVYILDATIISLLITFCCCKKTYFETLSKKLDCFSGN